MEQANVVSDTLLVIMNRKEVLGRHTNGLAANLLGLVVVVIAAGLGIRSILSTVDLI